MATIVFSAIGTAVGGPLGGTIGALIGQQVDRAIIGTPRREGPRLKELTVQTSSYGNSFPRVFGRMRLSGTVIWATDLVERRSQSGGGKRSPKTTNYSYSASFAVALSSRPIHGVGRIWADGNLLRGADGALSAGGSMRIYHGHGDALPDPLIAAATGDGPACCAFRGLAYAVFEDLPLGDFGNRIPSLSFEVLGDAGDATLADLLATEAQVTALEDGDGPQIAGFIHEGGSLADALAQFSIARPLSCRAGSGDVQLLYPPGAANQPIAIPSHPVPPQQGGQGGQGSAEDARGWLLARDSTPQIAPLALRYYDVARDYQIGLQRSLGPSEAAQPQQIELPAALEATAARQMIEALRDQSLLGAERLQWRMAVLDPSLAPGSVVQIDGWAGRWQVDAWEWVDHAVELTMQRIASPRSTANDPVDPVDPGQAVLAPDLPGGPTRIIALEQPALALAMAGNLAASEDRALLIGASSAAAGWRGAEIFHQAQDGSLASIGTVSSTRAVMGQSVGALALASAMIIDTASRLTVQLVDPQFQLVSTTPERLSEGANLALLGEELLQFLHAQPLGEGLWMISGLLRGRAGTQAAIAGHLPDEAFLLLDGLTAMPTSAIPQGSAPAQFAAIGQSDAEPVAAPLRLRGMASLPLAPCHPRWTPAADVAAGGGILSWTRRSRRGGLWLDGADAPLAEQAEQYLVEATFTDGTTRNWLTNEPRLALSAADHAQLGAPDAQVLLRQLGDGGRSPPLALRIPLA